MRPSVYYALPVTCVVTDLPHVVIPHTWRFTFLTGHCQPYSGYTLPTRSYYPTLPFPLNLYPLLLDRNPTFDCVYYLGRPGTFELPCCTFDLYVTLLTTLRYSRWTPHIC